MHDKAESPRVTLIRRRLETALQPSRLEISDESHLHAGHAGARDGRGHFSIRIAASALAGQARLAQQRKVYAALGELMQSDIHALSIQIIDEQSSTTD